MHAGVVVVVAWVAVGWLQVARHSPLGGLIVLGTCSHNVLPTSYPTTIYLPTQRLVASSALFCFRDERGWGCDVGCCAPVAAMPLDAYAAAAHIKSEACSGCINNSIISAKFCVCIEMCTKARHSGPLVISSSVTYARLVCLNLFLLHQAQQPRYQTNTLRRGRNTSGVTLFKPQNAPHMQ